MRLCTFSGMAPLVVEMEGLDWALQVLIGVGI